MSRRHLILAGLAAAFALPAAAAPYTAQYVFGDSLSDNGNLAAAFGTTFADPPFANNAFTNGPVAVELLANRLGLRADAARWTSAAGAGSAGTNYAVAGAKAGNTAPIDLPFQVSAFLARSGGTAPADALYTVFIGGNDVRNAALNNDTSFTTNGVASEIASIGRLLAAGAQDFLVVNVPDVGLIPEFTQDNPGRATLASQASVQYNSLLASGIASLAAANPEDTFRLSDLYSANNAFIANAASAGITNTTDPCYLNVNAQLRNPAPAATPTAACGPINPATNQATNIGLYQYWDNIHPTAKVQAAFAEGLFATVAPVSVPEPASMALLAGGVAGMILIRRRSRLQ